MIALTILVIPLFIQTLLVYINTRENAKCRGYEEKYLQL